MKDSFDLTVGLTSRLLSLDDWALIEHHLTKAYGEEGFLSHFRGGNPNNPKVLGTFMDRYAVFGLFHDHDMIGFSIIKAQDACRAHFAGSFLYEEYRGLGLANHLYDVRKKYLREIGFEGDVITSIEPTNAPSMKAAERNGFKPICKEELEYEGQSYTLVTLRLGYNEPR